LFQARTNGFRGMGCENVWDDKLSMSWYPSNNWDAFQSLLIPWLITSLPMSDDKITFTGFQSSHSDMPASSKLNTKSAFIPCVYSLRHLTIWSRKVRRISRRWLSWGILLTSHNSSTCHERDEQAQLWVIRMRYSWI
jgi:hypothetical protein